MRFERYIPCLQLRPFVSHIAIAVEDEARTYTVLPDTGLVIGLQFQGKLTHVHNGIHVPLSKAGITGLHDRFRKFQCEAGTGSVLIFFNTTGARHFFRLPMHELYDASISLADLLRASEVNIVEDKLSQATTDMQRVQIVEQFLLTMLHHTQENRLINAAVARIRQSQGTLRIRDLSLKLYTSQSPFEKQFRAAVGISAKKFASIIRFQNVLGLYASSNDLTSLAHQAGYFDQAHFNRDFKTFSGKSPRQFFSANHI